MNRSIALFPSIGILQFVCISETYSKFGETETDWIPGLCFLKDKINLKPDYFHFFFFFF